MGKIESLHKSQKKSPHRIIVKKNIIGDYALDLEKRFVDEIKDVQVPVVLDLTGATVVNSRGVALCVGLFKECQRKNITFSIETSKELSRFFKLLKLDRLIQFTEKKRNV